MKERIIFHIDVNNAFLSWTAVLLLNNGYKEDIRNIPSIIGGDEKTRRGIVLAKSPVAKKMGIKTAETLYTARKKCPGLKIFPPDYRWYYKKSKELINYLSEYSPTIEQYSIDECFLDMSGMKYLYDSPIDLAYKIKDEIKQKYGYTVNVGIGNNKLCAKMASDFEKPDKVHTLLESEIEEKLWPLPVNDLFMCGRKTSEELNKLHIYTIKDLATADLKLLERKFKSQGRYLKEAALGIDNSKVEQHKSKNQSISISETLPHNCNEKDKLKEIVFRQTEELCRELRSKNLYAKTVGIVFKNSNFKTYSAQTTTENATNNTKEILEMAYKTLEENYKEDDIRLIGVRLSTLVSSSNKQISLFEEKTVADTKESTIQKTIDEINNKFGKSLVKPASLKLVGETHSKKSYKE